MELSDSSFFLEFGAELPLDNCTPTIILNNPVYSERVCLYVCVCVCVSRLSYSACKVHALCCIAICGSTD